MNMDETDLRPQGSQNRVVKLSGRYVPRIREMFATLEPEQVQLTILSTGTKSRQMLLSMEEAQALATALALYKADVLAAQWTEEARQVAVLKEALTLAESVEGIVIAPDCADDLPPSFDVAHEWLDNVYARCTNADELLASVKATKVALDEWHGTLEEAKSLIAELGLDATITVDPPWASLHIEGEWHEHSMRNDDPGDILRRLTSIRDMITGTPF